MRLMDAVTGHMSLQALQTQFALMVARLIVHATELDYEPTLGEAYRTPEQAAINAKKGTGIEHSLHCDRLAIDILLFKGGIYLTSTCDYEQLGEWWESIGGTWGGRFKRDPVTGKGGPDGDHFSLAYQGRK